MLASPVFLLGSTLATMWAALFHLLLGRRWVELVFYWCLSLLGFAVGQAMANALGLRWMMVGQTHIIEGTVGCWVSMLVARWIKI